MALQVAITSAGSEAGQAFGGQFLGGFKGGLAKQEQKLERDAAAQEMIQATQAMYGAELERVQASIPEEDPSINISGEGEQLSMNLPTTLGSSIPLYLNPGSTEDQDELDGLSGAYARGIKSFKTPEAAEVYTAAAAKSLDMFHSKLAGKKLTGTLNASLASGAATEAEIAPFLQGIEAGEDPAQVYQEWQDFAKSKVETSKREARADRMIQRMVTSQENFTVASAASEDPEDSAWLQEQAERMEDLVVEISSSLAFGVDDFDADGAFKAYQDIKYALNPRQEKTVKAHTDLEVAKLKGLYSALGEAIRERDQPMAARIQSEIDGIGPAPPQVPGGIAHPDTPAARVAPMTPGPGLSPQAPAAPVQAPAQEPRAPGEPRAAKRLRVKAEKILSNPETGREGTISKQETPEKVLLIVSEAMEDAGIDLDGDLDTQIQALNTENKRILAAVQAEAQARIEHIAHLEAEAQRVKEQEERQKTPASGLSQSRVTGGGSPGTYAQLQE